MARARKSADAPVDPSQPVIRIRDLYRIYRMGGSEVRALDGISLDVHRGEFVAIMGPSGSGKSTLMNIVGCLDRPTAGSYVLDGVEISNLDRDRRAEIRNDKIGFVFQNFNLLARTNALENVELPLLYSAKTDLTDAERRARARRCLERVGLAERWDHTSAQLSGGQQQRVAIARSLVNDPAILLADEPTGNLDSRTSEEVIAIFQALNGEGRTVVLITHDTDIAQFAQRVVAFRDGKIISDHQVVDRRRAVAGSFEDAAPAATPTPEAPETPAGTAAEPVDEPAVAAGGRGLP
ncbi:MAG TPA: ABC transporter ATP-binding protein [Thermoanaerobaculia bacterium]|nr:ABC transporter ATP-binding protein [Thermoanaerobaculia bacterium]